MKEKMEEQLSRAVSGMIPDNMYERISQQISQSTVSSDERRILMNTTAKKRFAPAKWIGTLAAACFLLAIGIFGAKYYSSNIAIDSIVDIDVNPSIEIAANKKDKVINVTAINTEAEEILDGMDLRNTDLKVAVNAIIGSLAQKGYLSEDGSGILVTVRNDDVAKAQSIRNIVVSDITNSLKNNQINASVINQTVTSDKTAEDFASEQGISLGKAIFILNLAAKDSSLDPSALAAMSLRDIAGLVNEKKIDIRDIVDYDADDSLFENIAEGIEDANEMANVGITAAEAKEAALNHAGISADSAAFIRVELDHEDSYTVYEVEFRANNVEYEYKINAAIGEVLKAEKDSDHQTSEAAKITAEEAKAAALIHAGVSVDDTRILKTEFDYDDGVPTYEVDFIAGTTEYEYEIHAVSGTVIAFEKEEPEDKNTENSSSVGSVAVSLEDAKKIALTHAGVNAADAVFQKAETDTEDGHTVYEIEFVSGAVEYDYEIDAKTGAVLSSEKDTDD